MTITPRPIHPYRFDPPRTLAQRYLKHGPIQSDFKPPLLARLIRRFFA